MPTDTNDHVLLLRFRGAPRPLAQLKARTVAKAVRRDLNARNAEPRFLHHDGDAAEVAVATSGVQLLELRERWAKGLWSSHQGVEAAELVVYDGTAHGDTTEALDASGAKVVALRRV